LNTAHRARCRGWQPRQLRILHRNSGKSAASVPAPPLFPAFPFKSVAGYPGFSKPLWLTLHASRLNVAHSTAMNGAQARVGAARVDGRVIVFENVAYSYGGGELLSEVSLILAPGSFHFLTGPSGAGKSTLLKLCYAELLPTTGTITIFDRDVKGLKRDDVALTRRRIGMVQQDCQFLDHLPLVTNVTLPLTVAGRDTSAQDVTDLLAWVGLAPLADALPPMLSGGERQRAAVARAIIMGPDVILADEPTGNLDWDMSQRLLALLIELNRMGKTILIATHDLNLIRTAKAQVAARVLRIKNRRVQLAGADL
jgi:cell division transport system ATP-binding protein